MFREQKRNCRVFVFIISAFIIGVLVSGAAFYMVPIKTVASSGVSDVVLAASQNPVGAGSIADMVDKASPAVVMIQTKTQSKVSTDPFFNDPFFRNFFGGSLPRSPQYVQGMGSGFLISSDGYILTNEHVVGGADQIEVIMTGKEKPVTAKLVGSDAELDLAVLKIREGNDLPYLELGDSDSVRVGEWVTAIGNPQGLDHTVTVGVISAKGRPVTVVDRQYKNLLQTDASINPGNSGGPLLNTQGQVIGINTAVSSSAQGIGFAIPTSTVRPVLDTLINEGKISRPWLGVYIQTLTEDIVRRLDLNISEGVLVTETVAGGPAEAAGIVGGDVITKIGETKVNNTDALIAEVAKYKPNDKVVVQVYRNGKAQDVKVTIGEKE